MTPPHSKPTIVGMAVIASAFATLLHEGLGHGVTAWLRGDIPTELTSNHFSALHDDKWVSAAGTLVNLGVGAILILTSGISRSANLRYFLWLFAALNMLPGAGYFLFSGILGVGDWQAVIHGLPHESAWRIGMSVFGAILYFAVVKMLAGNLRPFCSERSDFNTVGRLPYYAACLFSCLSGLLDPLGWSLMIGSTIPAAFGGSSGLMWADSLMPKTVPASPMRVEKQPAWWISAIVLGLAYILILGPGIKFAH